MRIITFTSSNGVSGGVRQAQYQTDYFRSLGYDAYLCLPHDSEILKQAKDYYIPFPENEKDWKKKLEDLFIPHQTIVHAFHNRALKLISWWGIAWLKQGVFCVAHRGIITMPKNPFPYLSPAVKRIFPNSEACANALRFHCPKHKIKTVPNGIPKERVTPIKTAEEVRKQFNLDAESFYIAFVGNSNPIKGHVFLLEAFEKANIPNAKLLLVGIGSGNIPQQFLYLEEERKIVCCHVLEHVVDILQLCDIFAFPSLAMDSAPNTVLEALNMALPIVSADVGGAKEIIQDNGIIVPRNDSTAFAKALSMLANDKEARKLLSQKAKKRAEYYSMQNRCEILLSEYKKILNLEKE